MLTLHRRRSLPRNIHRRTRIRRRRHNRDPHRTLPLGALGRLDPHHRRHGPPLGPKPRHLHPRLDLHNPRLRPRSRTPLPQHGLLNPSGRRPALHRLGRRLLLLFPRLRPNCRHRYWRNHLPEPGPPEDPAVSAYCAHGRCV